MYTEAITEGITQALNDELTSAVLYQNMSEFLQGIQMEELRNEMLEHASEEFEHFKLLLKYANAHGIPTCIGLNPQIANETPMDFVSASSLVQELELKAISLYERLSKLAQEHEDIESMHFFKELMEKETEHFDDVAKLTGDIRPLSRFEKEFKSVSQMTFGDYLALQDQSDETEVEVEIEVPVQEI